MKYRWDVVLWVVGIIFMSGMSYAGWRYETRITVLEAKFDIIQRQLDRIEDKLNKTLISLYMTEENNV